MGFYHNSKVDRIKIVESIYTDIEKETRKGGIVHSTRYFADEDTYIRKAAYQAVGRIYLEDDERLPKIITVLHTLEGSDDFRVRQTVINAAGEIGKKDFAGVQQFFDNGLFDKHHSPRNAVIGSVKKMGEVNPGPVLSWARKYLHHADKEIRREICHGIELRGRVHPEDILPLLKELQHDSESRVRTTLVHVIGQISYKKGCLAKVLRELKTWKNKILVEDALREIVDVHKRYKDFAVLSVQQAHDYIDEHFK